MSVMNDEERTVFKLINNSICDCLRMECHRRCPSDKGYCAQCEFCDVQHILNVVSAEGKYAAEKMGLYRAVFWLINNAHPYLEDWKQRRVV